MLKLRNISVNNLKDDYGQKYWPSVYIEFLDRYKDINSIDFCLLKDALSHIQGLQYLDMKIKENQEQKNYLKR